MCIENAYIFLLHFALEKARKFNYSYIASWASFLDSVHEIGLALELNGFKVPL